MTVADSFWLWFTSAIFLLLQHLVTPGESIAVAALEDHRASLCLPSDNITSWLQNDTSSWIPDLSDAQNLTICSMIRPELLQPFNPATIFLYHSENSNASVTAGINSFQVWVEVGDKRLTFNGTLTPEMWNPLCVGLSSDSSSQVWAGLHGYLLAPVHEEEKASGATEKFPGLCLGSIETGTSTSFTGLVAAVTLVPGLLNDSAVDAMSVCRTLVAINQTSRLPLDHSWDNHGPVEVIEIEEEDLCCQSSNVILFRNPDGYDKFRTLCRRFGGHLPTEKEIASGTLQVSADVTESCPTDKMHVSWVTLDTPVDEGLMTQCPTLLANGTISSRVCVSELECSLCVVPAGLRYTLYGAIRHIDRYYNLTLLPDGNIAFEGSLTSDITREGDGAWVLRSRIHRQSWYMRTGSWPVGRHLWYSGTDNTTLTLTSCNTLQFPSRDGSCLLRSQRCDGHQDSADGGDEEGCQARLMNKEPGYNSHNGPYHGLTKKGVLMYRFMMNNIGKITTKPGVADIEMSILLKWHDPRIRFVDTKMTANYLNCDDIWHPRLGLCAGYHDGPEVDMDPIFTYCFVYWKKKLVEYLDLDDPFMGKFISAGHINITQFLELRFSLPCQFKLHRYPFGTYLCNATFYLVRTMAEMVWRQADTEEEDATHYEVPYPGDRDLLDYYLQNITVEIVEDYVTLTLHLTGQFDYHLLNTFAPSALVFIICYSTLYFPITDFNERIMGSLTSMLVMTGLFNQATDSYVKTPYYKLLDIWFATLIMLCFVVVLVNTLVNSLRLDAARRSYISVVPKHSDQHSPHDDNLKLTKTATNFNLFCKYVLLCFFTLILFLYTMFAFEAF